MENENIHQSGIYQIGIYLLAMLITIKNTLNQKVSSWIRYSLNCMDILSKFIMQYVEVWAR